jgi:hypothetical protein
MIVFACLFPEGRKYYIPNICKQRGSKLNHLGNERKLHKQNKVYAVLIG